MPRISSNTIEQIKARTDILEIVSDFVQLKQRGRNYFGLCPFHEEKTPSFSVNPSLGIFHCFGCGKGGNAVTFIMEYEKID
ncbi:MAG TPA: CHC2 zinc finger domain-containing protein, partial [Candidatus Marinimicrobia bacterium]|nr:CHC2 zinc finger domain-containing protein [Candidatus Neomarinimicrobiota bacterium]